MKRYKLRKYQMPRMVETNLETEGFLCDSFSLMIDADPLRNMSDPTDSEAKAQQNYFEF